MGVNSSYLRQVLHATTVVEKNSMAPSMYKRSRQYQEIVGGGKVIGEKVCWWPPVPRVGRRREEGACLYGLVEASTSINEVLVASHWGSSKPAGVVAVISGFAPSLAPPTFFFHQSTKTVYSYLPQACPCFLLMYGSAPRPQSHLTSPHLYPILLSNTFNVKAPWPHLPDILASTSPHQSPPQHGLV